MFVLSPKNLEVFWPVTIAVPMDGGEVEEFTFECKFKVLNTDEFQDKYPAFAANINDIKDLPICSFQFQIFTFDVGKNICCFYAYFFCF